MGDNSTIVGGTLPQRMPSCLSTLDRFLACDLPLVSSYIRADTGTSGHPGHPGQGPGLLQAIGRILGVQDVSQLDLNANLGDLGLDSLVGVEIRKVLERDFDLVLSMKDIRTVRNTRN